MTRKMHYLNMNSYFLIFLYIRYTTCHKFWHFLIHDKINALYKTPNFLWIGISEMSDEFLASEYKWVNLLRLGDLQFLNTISITGQTSHLNLTTPFGALRLGKYDFRIKGYTVMRQFISSYSTYVGFRA